MSISIDALFQTISYWIERKVSQTYNKSAKSIVRIYLHPDYGIMRVMYDISVANAMHIRSLAMESLMYFGDRYEIDEDIAISTSQINGDPCGEYTRWFAWNDGEVTVSEEPPHLTKYKYLAGCTIYPRAMGSSHSLKLAHKSLYGCSSIKIYGLKSTITKIIFSGPCTIVLWSDGDKTMVRRQGDEPDDKEKAVLAAVAKKFMGSNPNKSDYLDEIKPFFEKALKNLEEQNKKEKK